MLLIFRWIWLFVEVPNRQILRQNKHEKYAEQVKKCTDFENDIKFHDKIRIPDPDSKRAKRSRASVLFELIPIIALIVFYIIYGIILWSVDQDFERAYPKKVELERAYSQGVYFPLGWTLIISCSLILLWYRCFEKNKYELNSPIILFGVGSFIVIFISAIIYSTTVLKDYSNGTQTVITSGFIAGAFAIFTCMMFYGYWSSNGYVFYVRHKFRIKEYNHIKKTNTRQMRLKQQNNDSQQQTSQGRMGAYVDDEMSSEEQKEGGSESESHQSEESEEGEYESVDVSEMHKSGDSQEDVKDDQTMQPFSPKPKPSPSNDDNQWEPQENRLKKKKDKGEDKQKPAESYAKMIIPEDLKDKVLLSLFWINMIGLFLCFLINVAVFTPVWIPFTAYFWVMIAEFFLLGFFKYYSLNYDYKHHWVIIPALVCLVFYVMSFLMFIILPAEEDDKDERNSFLIVLLLVHLVLFPALVLFCGVYLRHKYGNKYGKNDQNLQNRRIKYLMVAAAVFFIILGVVLMAAWEVYAAGAG